MIYQKNDKSLDNLLQTVLGRRYTGQLPPVKELRQPQRRNLENNLEKEVICPKEGNSNNLESSQGDIEVSPPSQEREDNLEDSQEQEGAELCETRDLTPTPLDSGVEGGSRGPPATG